MELTLPYLPIIDYSPFIFLFLCLFFKFYDVIKVVNIHKSNRFGIKNWPLFCFVGVNGAE